MLPKSPSSPFTLQGCNDRQLAVLLTANFHGKNQCESGDSRSQSMPHLITVMLKLLSHHSRLSMEIELHGSFIQATVVNVSNLAKL